MDAVTLIKKKEYLTREFLTWLWFRSDTGDGLFDLPGGKSVKLWLGNRVVLASDPETHASTLTWSGETGDLREARVALAEGKKVTEARYVLEMDGEEWVFTLDSVWLNLKSLKTPKVEKDDETDQDALMLEKIHLVKLALQSLEGLCRLFVRVRTSGKWTESELPRFRKWIKAGQ